MPGHMAHLRAALLCARLAYGHLAKRVRSESGVVSSEYMGILLVVALIISALLTLDVDGVIAREISSLIDSVSKGEDPKAQ